jgi:hypothetical protein
MEKFDIIKELEKEYQNKLNIVRAKNADYADTENDPFKNFKYCQQLGVCSVEEGFIVRMSDKMARISNLLHKDAKVKDESIKDTLRDLSNYADLLLLYISKKEKEQIK